MSECEDRQLEVLQVEWNDKLRRVGPKRRGCAHFSCEVEILEAEPPDEVLINFADDWGSNFGGTVYRYTREGRRFASVEVYTD